MIKMQLNIYLEDKANALLGTILECDITLKTIVTLRPPQC